jgi:hypothetical protein
LQNNPDRIISVGVLGSSRMDMCIDRCCDQLRHRAAAR